MNNPSLVSDSRPNFDVDVARYSMQHRRLFGALLPFREAHNKCCDCGNSARLSVRAGRQRPVYPGWLRRSHLLELCSFPFVCFRNTPRVTVKVRGACQTVKYLARSMGRALAARHFVAWSKTSFTPGTHQSLHSVELTRTYLLLTAQAWSTAKPIARVVPRHGGGLTMVICSRTMHIP